MPRGWAVASLSGSLAPVATRALSRGRPTSCGPQVIYCEIRDIGTWFSRSVRRVPRHTAHSAQRAAHSTPWHSMNRRREWPRVLLARSHSTFLRSSSQPHSHSRSRARPAIRIRVHYLAYAATHASFRPLLRITLLTPTGSEIRIG